MGSKMSLNPLKAVMNLLFGDSDDANKKRQLEESQHMQQLKDPNDRWIQDYDDKRRRIYYYNPKLQEISWKMPTATGPSQSKLPNLASSLLPEHSDWEVAYDRTNGAAYYYNAKTQEAQWERPQSTTSCARVVMVEFENKTSVVAISKSKKACFAVLRQAIIEQLDADMRPPNGHEWGFQVSGATISRQQETDTKLFQALLIQSQDNLKVKIVSIPSAAAANAVANDREEAAVAGAVVRHHRPQQTPPSSPPQQQRNHTFARESSAAGTTGTAAPGPSSSNLHHHVLDKTTATLPPRALQPQQKRATPTISTRKQAPTASPAPAPPMMQTSPTTGRPQRPPPPPPPKRRTRSSSKEGHSTAVNDNDWAVL